MRDVVMYDYGERVNQCADYGDVRLRGKGQSMCGLWRRTITGKRSVNVRTMAMYDYGKKVKGI